MQTTEDIKEDLRNEIYAAVDEWLKIEGDTVPPYDGGGLPAFSQWLSTAKGFAPSCGGRLYTTDEIMTAMRIAGYESGQVIAHLKSPTVMHTLNKGVTA